MTQEYKRLVLASQNVQVQTSALHLYQVCSEALGAAVSDLEGVVRIKQVRFTRSEKELGLRWHRHGLSLSSTDQSLMTRL